MALPRSKYVQGGKEGVYHCFSRCVRRAFLYGYDKVSQTDFSHRKAWLLERLRYLAAIFAIEVCAYAIMENHYHVILRIRPDIVASWSDLEVATRWLRLFPPRHRLTGQPSAPLEEQIAALASQPERIAVLRKRLCSLSWFMGRLNEFIARKANKEDRVKGRFWESRFKCQALLDEAAIASCMVYVDLNPVRAGLAETPEKSNFTSIQERIHAWQSETVSNTSVPTHADQNTQFDPWDSETQKPENMPRISNPVPERTSGITRSPISSAPSISWLCPIQSDFQRRGILQITTAEYFDLLDKSGRLVRSDKRGVIDSDLAPILLRIGANYHAWSRTVSFFGSAFRLAAGRVSNLRAFAHQLGSQRFQGISMARSAFTSALP